MTIRASVSFETNDLSQFNSTVDPDGDLSVTTAAKMGHTNYGMSVIIDDQNLTYGKISGLANATGLIRARLYFSPNGITMADQDAFSFFMLQQTAGSGDLGEIKIKKDSGVYNLAINIVRAGGNTTSAYVAITDAPHYIEVYLQRASGDGIADGSFTWWLDGVAQTGLLNYDNYTEFPDWGGFIAGAVSGVDAGTNGTIFIDEIIANDDGSEIGPVQSLVFGFAIPTDNESPVSWDRFDDGAAGAVSVSGDADWGKLELIEGAEGRSQVYDLGDSIQRTYTLTENLYGTGQGEASLEIRGDTNPFAQDDALPAWTAYTVPVTESWRYVQVRESRE